eukprot:gene11428-biopygen9109
MTSPLKHRMSRTLSAEGKLNELEKELGKYRWSVVGIADMRWCNSGETISKEAELKDADVQENLRIKVGEKFAPLMELTDLQKMRDRFAEGMNEVAMEVLGKEKRKKPPWMTDEVLDKCNDRRKLKATKFKDEESSRNYREANRLVKKEIKKAKEEFLQRKCEQIERAFQRNGSKIAYSVVKELTKIRWTEYAQELYIYPISRDDNIIMTQEQESFGDTDEEPGIMMSEIEEALRSLKNGKASELLKNGGGCTIEILHKKRTAEENMVDR